jgi:hypothetical protein
MLCDVRNRCSDYARIARFARLVQRAEQRLTWARARVREAVALVSAGKAARRETVLAEEAYQEAREDLKQTRDWLRAARRVVRPSLADRAREMVARVGVVRREVRDAEGERSCKIQARRCGRRSDRVERAARYRSHISFVPHARFNPKHCYGKRSDPNGRLDRRIIRASDLIQPLRAQFGLRRDIARRRMRFRLDGSAVS